MRNYASDLSESLNADLLRAGWCGSSIPYPGQTQRNYAMMCLSNAVLKKFRDGADDTADVKALALFEEVNSSCKSFTWDPSRHTEIDAVAIGEAKNFLYEFFYPDHRPDGTFRQPVLNFRDIIAGMTVGNGANIGCQSTDYLSKIGTSTMAATDQGLYELFRAGISSERLWTDVESIRQKMRGNEYVKGSRLSFVPKTREVSRTICTEPLLNMFFQLGIGNVLRSRLQEVSGIDLSTQPDKNRHLARLGSKNGRFGTIDLSSASDSMSLTIVKEFFPADVITWLMRTRSDITTLPGGREVVLHMVSSMGNGYTFPLQTIFFLSLVYGVYRARNIALRRPSRQSLGNFAVFGDDIIVLNEAYDHVSKLLMMCGFRVNVDKSFNDGFFRESCGRDYYCGYNVRGVYIRTLKDVHDRYSAINRLNVWSAKHGIPLPRAVSSLLIGTRKVLVPYREDDTAGIKVPLRLVSKVKRSVTGSVLYRASVPDVISYNVTDVELRPPRIRNWFTNHEAVLMAALAGTLRLGRVVPRSNAQLRRFKSRSVPCWDWIFDDTGEFTHLFEERWKSFSEGNLNFS